MKSYTRPFIGKIALLCTLALGCTDPAPPTALNEDMIQSGGIISQNDDMMVDVDVSGGSMGGITGGAVGGTEGGQEGGLIGGMSDLDMEVPDQMVIQDPLYQGAECVENAETSPCGPHESCINGQCRFDLRPTVFRMTEGRNLFLGDSDSARASANIILSVLNSTVQDDYLNLLFEPGFYTDDNLGYWFVGNGLPGIDGYVYRRTFPIQNFTGTWRTKINEDGQMTPYWQLEGQLPFILAFPTGFVAPADAELFGERFQCTETVPTTVNVKITPDLSPNGEYERIRVNTVGFLTREDVEKTILYVNGAQVAFSNFFSGVALSDINEDGIVDEYPFELELIATPIAFIEALAQADQLDQRNPMPTIPQPPECGGDEITGGVMGGSMGGSMGGTTAGEMSETMGGSMDQ